MDQEDRRHRYLLLSLGNDGKVLVWELVSGHKELKVVKGLRLLTESVPRSIRVSKAKGNVEIGGMYCTRVNFSVTQMWMYLLTSQARACPFQVRTRTCLWLALRMEASTNAPYKL